MENIRIELGDDGVALLTIDVAGSNMNVFTPGFTRELEEAVAWITGREDILGVILTSGKTNGFMAGADLTDLVHVHGRGMTAQQAAALVAPAAKALRELERCGKPVAAAINGLALGGGFELCLACHYRVLENDPGAVVGLPEVTVGLLPAGGGTQRLPRLIGIAQALPILLTGRHIRPEEALRLNLVDAVAPRGELVEAARRWVLQNPDWLQPWDRKGHAVPGGVGAMAGHAMESFSLGMATIRRDTQDNYPAPPAILAAVYEGTQVPFERGLAIEQAYFGELLAGPVARNLMRTLFINKGLARKLVRRPGNLPRQPVQRLGILGAGMMGAGIAQVGASKGVQVILVDRDQESADRGKAQVAASYAKDTKSGRCTFEEAEARLRRIEATPHYAALDGCDLVVEAVFEDRAVKSEALRRAREALGALPSGFVMASNTSTLPITSLADGWPQPREFIGLHFFSPVDRMPLVEVILGRSTSQAALARALDFVAQLGKVPIVVNDSPGFYTSRIFCSYIDEGMAMLAEGVLPALIENAARQAGYGAPPLAVTDEVSLDLQKRVIDQAVADGLPARFLRQHSRPVVEAMLAEGRLGRKTGGGFHDFTSREQKRLWPGLSKLFPVAAQQPTLLDVKHRLLYMQALESARCVEEGVVPEAADADLGSILGLGFPSWTGGTLSFIDTVGTRGFVLECDRLADLYGERFRPSAWLRARAEAGQLFHPLPV